MVVCAGLPFRMLVAFMVVVAGADGAVRMNMLLVAMVVCADLPFRMLVAFMAVVAGADGAVRMNMFLVAVVVRAGFPLLVLVFVMAVVCRAGSAVGVVVFCGSLLGAENRAETENGGNPQNDGKIKTFHVCKNG